MYNAGVEEQVIQEFTGHHSLAIRSYKKTSDNQWKDANHKLYGMPKPHFSPFDEPITKDMKFCE